MGVVQPLQQMDFVYDPACKTSTYVSALSTISATFDVLAPIPKTFTYLGLGGCNFCQFWPGRQCRHLFRIDGLAEVNLPIWVNFCRFGPERQYLFRRIDGLVEGDDVRVVEPFQQAGFVHARLLRVSHHPLRSAGALRAQISTVLDTPCVPRYPLCVGICVS